MFWFSDFTNVQWLNVGDDNELVSNTLFKQHILSEAYISNIDDARFPDDWKTLAFLE